MQWKVRVRSKVSKAKKDNGKPGKWMTWAAFADPQTQHRFSDALKLEHPDWDVQEYQGKAPQDAPPSLPAGYVGCITEYGMTQRLSRPIRLF